MRTARITFRDVPMECRYEWDAAVPRTWDDPGSPDNAQLYECRIGGVDVMDLLTADQIEKIEGELIEHEQGQRQFAASEYADMRRDAALTEN